MAREAIDCARAPGNSRVRYPNLSTLAVAVHGQGRWAEARELFEQALEVAREQGTPFGIGHALNEIGRAQCEEGRHDLARKHCAEGITILHGLGNRLGVIDSLQVLADVAAGTTAPRRAAQLWGAVDALRQEIGNTRSVHESIGYEHQVKAVRAILTGEAFDQAWDEGRAMPLDDAVRYALDEQARRDN